MPGLYNSNLGCALLDQEKLDDAIIAFREAIRLEPDAETHFRMGCALKSQEKLDLRR